MQILYTTFVQIIDLEAHNEYTGFGESRRTEATETPRAAAVVGRRPGVHRNTISKLENERGGSYPETIRKLAKALDVEPTELLQE
jgi:transcriptional regulator with XRE-family HTH domain